MECIVISGDYLLIESEKMRRKAKKLFLSFRGKRSCLHLLQARSKCYDYIPVSNPVQKVVARDTILRFLIESPSIEAKFKVVEML